MWILMNDSFVSVVENKFDKSEFVVRARVRWDLETLFPEEADDVIESEDSDYRFRLYLDKVYVSNVIRDRVLDIDYDNFKNTVYESWRKKAYTNIWFIMFKIQSSFYGFPDYRG